MRWTAKTTMQLHTSICCWAIFQAPLVGRRKQIYGCVNIYIYVYGCARSNKIPLYLLTTHSRRAQDHRLRGLSDFHKRSQGSIDDLLRRTIELAETYLGLVTSSEEGPSGRITSLLSSLLVISMFICILPNLHIYIYIFSGYLFHFNLIYIFAPIALNGSSTQPFWAVQQLPAPSLRELLRVHMSVVGPALTPAMHVLCCTEAGQRLWADLAGRLYVDAVLARIRKASKGRK